MLCSSGISGAVSDRPVILATNVYNLDGVLEYFVN